MNRVMHDLSSRFSRLTSRSYMVCGGGGDFGARLQKAGQLRQKEAMCFLVCRPTHRPSVNTYFAWRYISLHIERICNL